MDAYTPQVDLDDYDAKGFVVLRGAIDHSICESAEERTWIVLERLYGIRRSDTSTWTIEDPRGLTRLRREGALEATATPEVIQAVEEILGSRPWKRPRPWGGALVTFPSSDPWEVPEKGWHIDYPARGNPGNRFGVKMLGLLTNMRSHGGATLLSPGSHRLVRQLTEEKGDGDAGRSADVRRTLLERGVDFRVDCFEFTGSAGDVVLFDPWLFHVPSRNVRASPRMMVEQNIPSAAALQLYASA